MKKYIEFEKCCYCILITHCGKHESYSCFATEIVDSVK